MTHTSYLGPCVSRSPFSHAWGVFKGPTARPSAFAACSVSLIVTADRRRRRLLSLGWGPTGSRWSSRTPDGVLKNSIRFACGFAAAILVSVSLLVHL
jgi:hypothetical protein